MSILSDVPANDHPGLPPVGAPRQRWTLVVIGHVPITLEPGAFEPTSQTALRALWDDYARAVVDLDFVHFSLMPGHAPQSRPLREEDL